MATTVTVLVVSVLLGLCEVHGIGKGTPLNKGIAYPNTPTLPTFGARENRGQSIGLTVPHRSLNHKTVQPL